jgi:hypothetical protein
LFEVSWPRNQNLCNCCGWTGHYFHWPFELLVSFPVKYDVNHTQLSVNFSKLMTLEPSLFFKSFFNVKITSYTSIYKIVAALLHLVKLLRASYLIDQDQLDLET